LRARAAPPAARTRPAGVVMTILTSTADRRRTDVVAGRVYTIPVVRELPRPPAGPAGEAGW
jgi:hypothetical protein